METVIEATIPTDRFVLAETVDRVSAVEIEFVRLALQQAGCVVPFLWGAASQQEQLDDALQNDPDTDRVVCLSGGEHRRLYSLEWTPEATRRINELAAITGSVLTVRGTSDHWRVRTLFPDRETAAETFRSWRDDGINPSLSSISTISCEKGSMLGLSATQYETIARAVQTEYYSVPRETTLDELAADLKVSHQAVSERLRRGHSHLAERLLAETTTGREDQQ